MMMKKLKSLQKMQKKWLKNNEDKLC